MNRLVAVLIACLVVPAGFHIASDVEAVVPANAPATIEIIEADQFIPARLIVHYKDHIPDDIRSGEANGVEMLYEFASIPAVYVLATHEAHRRLSSDPSVAFIESGEKRITYAMNTATLASRSIEVTDPNYNLAEPAVYLPDGSLVDGRGIGVAVVDSGLDGTHPGFQEPWSQGGNYVMTDRGIIDGGPYTVMEAHGTMVAGIVSGSGAASLNLKYRGVAPGATLYSFAIGPERLAVHPAMAFDWILQNGQSVDPPIRIVTAAWGCTSGECRAANEDLIHLRLAQQLAEAGYVVVFAGGNHGGDGFNNQLNPEAVLPTPGILGVSSYDDRDLGVRISKMAGKSSRGFALDPATWPDLAAPGEDTRTAYPIGIDTQELPRGSRVPGIERRAYDVMHGTSAAAAHIAGVAALLLHMNPALTPAEVEYILEATATPLTHPEAEQLYVAADPTHPWGPANFEAGHGLVDALEATRLAGAFTGIPSTSPTLEAIPEAWEKIRVGVEIETTFYLTPGSMNETFPAARVPMVQAAMLNEPVNFTSAPFPKAQHISGAELDIWMGSAGECTCQVITGRSFYEAEVSKISKDGTITHLGSAQWDAWNVHGLVPAPRTFNMPFGEPVRFLPRDVIQVSFTLRWESGSTVTTPIPGMETAVLLYMGSPSTPSRFSIGQEVSAMVPDSTVWCKVRQDCADVGGNRVSELVHCDDATPFLINWYGPPASSLVLRCTNFAISCTVPGMPGDPWGRCDAEAPTAATTLGEKNGRCEYVVPGRQSVSGTSGRCVGLIFREDDD